VLLNMENRDPPIIRVSIPVFDINVRDPFKYKISLLKTEPITSLVIVAKLPPLFKTEVPAIEIGDLTYIVSPETLSSWRSSFEDIALGIPLLTSDLVRINEKTRSVLDIELRYRVLSKISIEPRRIEIEIPRPLRKDLPEDVRDRYSIKIKVRRELTPELREIIENRLTKEFRITRMIKKMEIVRDERSLMELELILKDIEKKLKLYRLAGKSPS